MSRNGIFGTIVVGIVLAATTAWGGGGLRDEPAQHRPDDGQHNGTANAAVRPSDEIQFGDPIPGLTVEQLKQFEVGKVLFEKVFTEEEGLGPIFNNDSCGVCHNAGASGGAGTITVTRFARFKGKGVFDPLEKYGGSLHQVSGINEDCMEDFEFVFDELDVPLEARIVTLRLTTPMFGAGLIEAIPDDTLLDLEDPDDLNGDGISGRAHIVFDPFEGQERVGRFGWKAQDATLGTFSAGASLNEMGITSVLFPDENEPNGILPPDLIDCDFIADPEDVPDAEGVSNFEKMADFQRLLAPPPRLPLLEVRGAALFRQIGCDDCHVPVLMTGDSEIAALANKPVFLFSDLLLHDMGSLGDNIKQGDAQLTELRTSPLWGMRIRESLLHDGRAADEDTRVREAIEEHAGEAAAARDNWLALPEADKEDVIRFLLSI